MKKKDMQQWECNGCGITHGTPYWDDEPWNTAKPSEVDIELCEACVEAELDEMRGILAEAIGAPHYEGGGI
ncbi:MAG: hypothetical protein KDC71_23700 [Acidobacteria bacterium]|nr:hypothetical protein [Acidobacteriota bacterium]